MWANLHLLFWLSLIPFVTRWLGENHTDTAATALYGIILLVCGAAYQLLQRTLVITLGNNSGLKQALGDDFKGKVSLVIYIVAIVAAFRFWWLADMLYVLPAIMWFIPDRRIEPKVRENQS